jgi:glutamate dehydrogenase
VRHGPKPLDVAATVAAFAPGVARLAGLLPALLSSVDREAADARAAGWVEAGAGKDLAARLALLDPLAPALDVVEVAGAGDLEAVATVYFALGTRLELDWLRDRISALPRDDRWQALARSALGDDYARERAALTADIVRHGASLDGWMAARRPAVDRFLAVIDDIRAGATPDLATLSVAMREARALSGPAA